MSWEKLVDRQSDYWKNYMMLSSLKAMEKIFGFTLKEHVTTRKGMNFTHWMSPSAARIFSYRVEQSIQKDGSFPQKVLRLFHRARRRLLAVNKAITQTDLSTLSRGELRALFRLFCDRYRDLYPAFHLGVYAITLEEQLRQWLWQTVKQGDHEFSHDALFSLLVAPCRLSCAQEEEAALCAIALTKKQEELLHVHIQRYAGLPVLHDAIPAWPRSYFVERLRKLLKQTKQQIEKKRAAILSTPFAVRQERERMLHVLRAPRLMRIYARFLSQTTWIRCTGRNTFCLAHHASRPLFQEIGYRHSLSPEEVKWLNTPEIHELLTYGRFPSPDDIAQRKARVVLLFRNGTMFLKHGKGAEQFIREELREATDMRRRSLMWGAIAYPGRVLGRVKIILTQQEGQKMHKGDILVTRMTTTDLTLVIQKASAIITDEGGITCHAAIIARELRVPCIVGTQFATRALKDGDRVEVDAIRGVVRKV